MAESPDLDFRGTIPRTDPRRNPIVSDIEARRPAVADADPRLVWISSDTRKTYVISGGAWVEVPTPPTIPTVSSSALSFVNGDTLKRFTIADAAVTAASKIVGTIVRPTVADKDDLGWTYLHTIVSRGAGTFDLLVAVFDWNSPAGATRPNETVTFCYLLG